MLGLTTRRGRGKHRRASLSHRGRRLKLLNVVVDDAQEALAMGVNWSTSDDAVVSILDLATQGDHRSICVWPYR